MDSADAKAAVLSLLLRKPQLFVLCTVDEQDAPQARLMGVITLKDNVMCMACDSDSRKVRQIEKNPRVQVMCWAPDMNTVANVCGTVSMEHDPKARKEFWDAVPGCARHYSSPDDPGLGIMRIRLTHGEYLDRPAGYEITTVTF